MQLPDIFSAMNITSAEGSSLADRDGNKFLDFYSGFGAIVIGHAHPHYVAKVSGQLGSLASYPGTYMKSLQEEIALKLAPLSSYRDYRLQLYDSQAEAMLTACRAAGEEVQVVGFSTGLTDQAGLSALLPARKLELLEAYCRQHKVAAVVVEGLYSDHGLQLPEKEFLEALRSFCTQEGLLLIADERVSGYGCTGKFFAHQHAGVKADVVVMGRQMANGLTIGGLLISPEVKTVPTVYPGNFTAQAAASAVLDVVTQERGVFFSAKTGDYIENYISSLPGIRAVTGSGLMIAAEVEGGAARLQQVLLERHRILTGLSADGKHLYITPALTLPKPDAYYFVAKFEETLMYHLL